MNTVEIWETALQFPTFPQSGCGCLRPSPFLAGARAQEYLEGTGTNKEGSAIYDLTLMALLRSTM